MRITPRVNYPTGGPSLPKGPRVTKRLLQERMARQAAIESAYARYLKLICGHYQTLEEDQRVSHWRPKRDVTYCDNCHEWVAIRIPDRTDHTPDTPMF